MARPDYTLLYGQEPATRPDTDARLEAIEAGITALISRQTKTEGILLELQLQARRTLETETLLLETLMRIDHSLREGK